MSCFYKCLFSVVMALPAISLSAQTLTTSNLPIVIIETNGQGIPNEPKITANMKIIWNGPGMMNSVNDTPNEYNGKIGIEVRGASSAWYPQTPYAIETRDDSGLELNVPLFGFPEEHDWCLLSHYNEKTFSRFPLAFEMFREMGLWAPRCQLVEVLLNGEYRGIFLFCEKIKRDKNRVDIKKGDPAATTGSDELTGGYIFKIDYWDDNNSFPAALQVPGFPGFIPHFVYYYPKPEDLSTLQRNYLRNYINTFESVLYGPQYADTTNGYRKYIDVASFIDYFILSEVSRNNDAYKKSRYFFKDRDSEDPRIHAGPVWDFDWAWKNIAECSIFAQTNGSGWAYEVNTCNPDVVSPGWYDRLLKDTNFSTAVCQRYAQLRTGILATARLQGKVDSIAAVVATAQTRHYTRWPILSENGFAPEVNFIPTSYAGEVSRLKNWIKLRMTWLDTHIPQLCNTTIIKEPPVNTIAVYPNPATAQITLSGVSPYVTLRCFDVSGKQMTLPRNFIKDAGWQFDVSGLPNGMYILEFSTSEKTDFKRFVVARQDK